jgi:hypothetical protein
MSNKEKDESFKNIKVKHEKTIAKHMIRAMKEENEGGANLYSKTKKNLDPKQIVNAEYFRHYCSKRKAFINYKKEGLRKVSDSCKTEYLKGLP